MNNIFFALFAVLTLFITESPSNSSLKNLSFDCHL